MLFLEFFKGYITWDGSNGNNYVIADGVRFVVTELVFVLVTFSEGKNPGPGGGLAYKWGGGVRQKFWIKPLKETDLGLAQASFDL